MFLPELANQLLPNPQSPCIHLPLQLCSSLTLSFTNAPLLFIVLRLAHTRLSGCLSLRSSQTIIMNFPSSGRGAPSGSLFNSLRQSTSIKRKRENSLSSTHASSSWFGIAFQLPSVIKREFNDFVKTVRGGYPQAMESNSVDQAQHPRSPNPQAPDHRSHTHPRRKPTHSKKAGPSKTAPGSRSQFMGLTYPTPQLLTIDESLHQPMQLDCDYYHPDPTTDVPSPLKKIRLSESVGQPRSNFFFSPDSSHLSTSSGPTSPRPFASDAFSGEQSGSFFFTLSYHFSSFCLLCLVFGRPIGIISGD